MDARKVIFYSTLSPDLDDEAWWVFHYANIAFGAGVKAEIVLAGPAAGLIRQQVRDRLSERSRTTLQKVIASGIPIWIAPGCAEFRGVSDSDIKETGAKLRELGEMFGDVAAGAGLMTFGDG